MTDEQQVGKGSVHESPEVPPKPGPPPTPGNAIWNWLWQGPRAAELRRTIESRTEHSLTLLARAQGTLAAARALTTTAREGGAPSAVLVRLYLDACAFALQSLREARGEPATDGQSLVDVRLDLSLPADTFERGRETYDTFRSLDTASIWQRAPTSDQVQELGILAASLVQLAQQPRKALENVWFARLTRIGVPFVLLVIVALAGGSAWREAQNARGTRFPWRASSTFSAEQGCVSPSQQCAETRFFFSTNHEQSPWIEFDLGRQGRVSHVKVRNRSDCEGCAERALPLVVEVSDDRRTWKEVARKTDSFEEWTASFPPKQARWLRLKAEKRTFLHLKQVRIRN